MRQGIIDTIVQEHGRKKSQYLIATRSEEEEQGRYWDKGQFLKADFLQQGPTLRQHYIITPPKHASWAMVEPSEYDYFLKSHQLKT